MVADPAPDAARRPRLAVRQPVGLRGLAGAAGAPRGRRVGASSWPTSASATSTGSTTGSGRRARTRSPTRSASTASGARCGRTPPTAASGSWATSRSTWPPAPPTSRAHPGLFRTDLVAGVPPDAFTADGQLWGNPTYDWDAMARDGQRWWIERLRRGATLHDCLRIDHFRAFESWWGVPRDALSASEGAWYPGPGARGRRGRARAAGHPVAGGRGPRDHHAGGARAHGAPGPAGHAGAPVRLPRVARQHPPPRAPPRAQRGLQRHPRQRHGARLVAARRPAGPPRGLGDRRPRWASTTTAPSAC